MSEFQNVGRGLRQHAADRRARSRQEIHRALADAHAELDHIAEQFDKADRGQDYLRVGKVSGVDVNAVFGAFADIEYQAELDKAIERNTKEQS